MIKRKKIKTVQFRAGELLNINNTVLAQYLKRRLPVKVAAALYENTMRIGNVLRPYVMRQQELCDQYVARDENGMAIVVDGEYQIPDDKQAEYDAASRVIGDEVVDVEIERLQVKELVAAEMQLSLEEIMNLQWMLERR